MQNNDQLAMTTIECDIIVAKKIANRFISKNWAVRIQSKPKDSLRRLVSFSNAIDLANDIPSTWDFHLPAATETPNG